MFYSSRKLSATIHYDWNVANYPFDRHVLLVEMEDAGNDADALVFLPDTTNTRFDENIKLEGWKVTNLSLTARKNVYNTTFGDPQLPDGGSTYSRLVLAISIERESSISFWKLTAGVYAAFLLSLLGFFYDTAQTSLMSPRSGILVGSLFAAIVNMRAAEGVLGRAEGLTLVDKIHVLTIFFIIVGSLATVVSRVLVERGRQKQALRLDRGVLFPLSLVIFIIVNIVLVWQASYRG